MITISKYQIPKFQDIRSGYDFKKRTDLKYAAYIACLYYEFAYYQMLGFSDNNNQFFKENPEDAKIIDEYLHKGWSGAYAMYALLRTVIEAVRKINKALVDENSISSHYKTAIKNIVDITNDVVKHPMFNDTTDPSDASQAYRPVSLNIGGEIDIERWVDQASPSSTLEIDPFKDFVTVRNYLEHIAEILE